MSKLQYTKPTALRLKNHPDFSEKWVQERIADDPSILGLGELELRDVERPQPKAGRLDLLLRDPDTGKRYEVELMLGTVDESHIIRTLEYWDIERKRYPQYDHCAVIVAEDVTSRFLNVIGLFNSSVPIIALQMTAYLVGDNIMLTFARVLDEIVLGTEDEDDGKAADRAYWETKAPKGMLNLVDKCFEILKEVTSDFAPSYKKQYVGLAENGRPNNFITFKTRKKFIRVSTRATGIDEWKARLEDVGISVLDNSQKWGRVAMNLSKENLTQHRELIKGLFATAYEEQQG